MQPTITFPRGYEIPKFNVDQRTKQGKIIGIEVLPHDSLLAENCGHGYRYIVMVSRYTKEVKYLESELEDYLQVVIGRPVIIPALSEQLDYKQAECLDQITRFIQQYDQNLEQRLWESAQAGGEQLAAQLLEELSDWEPGRKPVQFKKKMEKHLMKVRVLLANASPEADSSLQQMMEHLDSIVTDLAIESKNLASDGRSQLQKKMEQIRVKLLDEQRNLQELATGEVGLSKATVSAFKFR